MMKAESCFARQVNQFSHRQTNIVPDPQVIDSAVTGYCAWGCFRSF
jgi:hypothetical protein